MSTGLVLTLETWLNQFSLYVRPYFSHSSQNQLYSASYPTVLGTLCKDLCVILSEFSNILYFALVTLHQK